MVKLDIKNKFSLGVTSISNVFLDKFMPYANGEYVKIYLFLLRLTCDCTKKPLTISEIADMLECTSSDIIRALSYWEKKGIVNCTFDTNSELTSLCFVDLTQKNSIKKISDKKSNDEEEKIKSPTKSRSINIPIEEKELLLNNDDIKDILYIAQKYLNKVLTKTEVDTILYFYNDLGFDIDLIDYLIDYCVSKNKKTINYIKKVAFSWYDSGICDVNQAKLHTKTYSDEYIKILSALGINRSLGAIEQEYINNWINSYKMDIEMIVKACNLTLKNIGKPSFPYVDTVLKNWIDEKITDIDSLKKSVNSQTDKKAKKNVFNNFHQRDYDFEKLEAASLNLYKL